MKGRWLWLAIFLAFCLTGIWLLDPDYGWHVQMGKLIVKQGIPKTDPFSYTMPSYPFVDHEWMFNIWMYLGDLWITRYGLAIIFGAMATAGLGLVRRWKGWELTVILAVGILMPRMGIRPQVLDWLLIAILWRLFEKRQFILMPIMFWFWTNMHGGYVIGLLMLWFMTVVRSIEERRWNFFEMIICVLSLVVTFINPYGWRIWWEVWMQFTDKQLRSNVVEWQPFVAMLEPAVWFLMVLWLLLIVKAYKDKKVKYWQTITAGVCLVAGLSSLRHMAIFAIVMVLELPRLLEELWQGLTEIAKSRATLIYKQFVAVALVIWGLLVVLLFISLKSGGMVYPEKAVEFLQTQNYSGQVFSEYGWGGYLIWKLPEKKVFIDGRMPSWRWVAPKNEADSAMQEYKKVIEQGDFEGVFSKYGIKTVLLPKSRKASITEKLDIQVKKWLGIKNDIQKTLWEKFKEMGWKKAYEDKVAVIWVKD